MKSIRVLVSVCGLILAVFFAGAVTADEFLVYTDEDLLDYIDRWSRRDGIAGQVISDYFLEFLGARPVFFLETMALHRETFDTWTKDLANLSFVDFGSCIDVRCKKDSAEKSMHLAQVSGDAEILRTRLLSRLQHIEIRIIE